MNRFVLGVVGAAAVLGTSGGVALAAAHDPATAPTTGATHATAGASATPTGPGARPTTRSSTTPEPTSRPTAASSSSPLEGDPGGPLYASGNVIHDGVATIRLREDKRISAFAQAAGGYLVATAGPASAPFRHDLWFVQTDELQKRIGTVAGAWDLSPDGRSVVGSNPATHLITVWDVSSGTIIGQWDRTTDATDQAVFVGDSVYITDTRPGDRYALSRWDVGADRTVRLDGDGLAGMTAAASGRYLAGVVGEDGYADPMREDACAAVRSTPLAARHTRWYSCEWGGVRLNAGGSRVLLTSPIAGHDAVLGVADAASGPEHGVTTLHPRSSVTAEAWGSDSGVLTAEKVAARRYQLESCNASTGACHVVATARRQIVPATTG